jgi:hypothetical protein
VCYSLWYNARMMLPSSSLEAPLPGYWKATSWVHYTTSCNTQTSAPEGGRDQRPKHVERIGIINKPLLLHLVGCLYHSVQEFVRKGSVSARILSVMIYDA